MEFLSLIGELEDSVLNRESVDCKKYDKTTITYRGKHLFAVTLNGTESYENVRQIIINDEEDSMKILIQNNYMKYNKEDISDINTITIGGENAT